MAPNTDPDQSIDGRRMGVPTALETTKTPRNAAMDHVQVGINKSCLMIRTYTRILQLTVVGANGVNGEIATSLVRED